MSPSSPPSAISLSLRDARVVLEQVPDHQRAPGGLGRGDGALGLGDRLGERLLDEAVLAGAEHALGELGVRGHRGGEGDGVERVVGEQVVERRPCGARGSAAPTRSSAAGSRVAQPGELAPGDGGEVAGEVRAPVAEPGHADA